MHTMEVHKFTNSKMLSTTVKTWLTLKSTKSIYCLQIGKNIPHSNALTLL